MKLEWSGLLEDCCHFVRGVGFDRPVVELLCGLCAMNADGVSAFKKLEEASAADSKGPALRLEAAALIAAIWDGAGLLGLSRAIEAVWSAPTQEEQLGFEVTYLLMQLHRCNAALHLHEPRQAIDLALEVCESVIWLAGTKPKALTRAATAELPLLTYLHQTLKAVAPVGALIGEQVGDLVMDAVDAMTRLAQNMGGTTAVAAVGAPKSK